MNAQVLPAHGAAAPAAAPFLSLRDALSDEQRLELVEYWRSITKRKWAILFLGVAVATAAGAVAYALPPIYKSTATIMIEPDKSKVVSIEEVYAGVGGSREHYQTQVEIIKSREVALRTIQALKLYDVPEFDPRKEAESWRAKAKLMVGLTEQKQEWDNDSLTRAVLGKFTEELDVQPVRLSQLVKVSFESQDPALAAKVVETVSQIYIDNDRDARFKLTQQASKWLLDQVGGLRAKLDASERALQTYRDKQGLVNVGGSVQAIDSQQVANVTQQLISARVKRAENESVYEDIMRIQKAGKGGDYTAVAAVMRHPSIIEAKKNEAAAQQKVSELAQRYGFEHPRIVQANAELKSAQANTQQQMAGIAASLVRDFEVSRATEKQLETILDSSRSSVQTVNRKEAQLGILEREVEGNKQLYDLFIGRAKETKVSGDLQTQIARVVDAPLVSRSPVKPKKEQIIAIALLLGLLAGALISLLLDKLDNTLKGSEDAESRLKQPILTSLPLLTGEDRKSAMRLINAKPDSMFSESIRTARTGVLLSNIDRPNKIILVTSSVPGEGKTVFTANVAFAHSATKKTLLIDADMRRPQISRNLGLATGAKGLSNLVSGTASLEECIHRIEGTELDVIPAGDIPPNPTELLLSERFKETLKSLSERYQIVLIDSPPVELVSDALVIAPQVTGTVYVVKAMETPYQLARKGLVRIQRAGGAVLGVTLNYVDFKKAQKYYGQYSAYGKYGYGDYGYKTYLNPSKA